MNPLKYYLAAEENGLTDTSDEEMDYEDDEDGDGDSVVIVGDDTDDSEGGMYLFMLFFTLSFIAQNVQGN